MGSKNHAQLIKALDLLLDMICIVDADGRYVAVGGACESLLGYTADELIGRSMLELVLPADRERTLQTAARIMSGNPVRNFENRYVRKDGQIVDIMWSACWSPADGVRVAVAREVTQRKRAESMQTALYSISEAAHSAEDLTDLFRRIHQIIGVMLPSGSFSVALYDGDADEMSFPYFVDDAEPVPPACPLDAGGLAAEVVRSGSALLLTPENRGDWPASVAADDGGDRLGVPLIADRRTIGALVVRSQSPAERYREQDMALLQFISTQIADHIERKRANDRLQYLAQHDALTGLPSRSVFDDRLRMAVATAARHKQRLALLYLDLDDFKPVNDRFGHAAGDQLLQQIGRRIAGCVRESDTVCRVGGDEFVVLLGAIQSPENAMRVAEKIRAAVHLPVELQGRPLQVSASIGIAVYPDDAGDLQQLTRHADAAMYDAKRRGRNQSMPFERERVG